MQTPIRGSRARLIVGVSLVLLAGLVAVLVRSRLGNAPEAAMPSVAGEEGMAEQPQEPAPPVVLPPSPETKATVGTEAAAPEEPKKPEAQTGVVTNWFMSRADKARKGAAMAAINEAKATFSVGFAKAYLAQAKAGGNVQVGAADVVQSAFGNPVTTGDQVTFGDVVVKIEFQLGQDDIHLTALTVKGEGVAGVTGVWTIPRDVR